MTDKPKPQANKKGLRMSNKLTDGFDMNNRERMLQKQLDNAYETMSKLHSLQLSPPIKVLETGIVIRPKPKYIPTRLWKYLVHKVTTKRDLELITNE